MVVVVARQYSWRTDEHMSGDATLACHGERSDVLNKYGSERAANVGMAPDEANTDHRWNNKSQEKRDECKSLGERDEASLRPGA